MKPYLYQKTTITVKKIVGTYSSEGGTITTADEQTKTITEELKDFNGQDCEIIIKTRSDEDLDTPQE